MTMDLYPTILAMLRLTDAGGHAPDGVSLTPLLAQSGPIPDRALFWHYPHYQHYQQGGTTPYGAIRRGDFKLIEFYDDHRLELYDLKQDRSEKIDLAPSRRELAEKMRAELHTWLRSVRAQMPTPNPRHDPRRREHAPAKKAKAKAG